MIEVSVIIPVYNEEKYIKRCLDSLIAQTYPREKMEWIIIDGNSSDRTVEIIEGFADRYPIRLLINQARKTPISMNMGIKASSGNYIVRFDAHTQFPEDYIDKCIHALENIDADNVGGYVDTKAEGRVGGAIASVLSSKFGVGDSNFRTERKSGYVDTVPFGAFKSSVFDRIGFFNEKLLRSEDNDINARIRESGGKIYLDTNIHSTYFCRDSIPGVLKMALQNGNALFRTLRENPKAMSTRHFIPFGFLVSIVLLPLLGLFIPAFMWIFIIEMISYGLLDLYFSLLNGNAKYSTITLWLYPLFHVFYGIGSLLGLMGIDFY